MKLISAKKIWDKAPHNAFTDLIRFQNRWFCVFREGLNHVSPDGALRIITSCDGKHWESAALIASPSSDLRDGKLSITSKNQLMLCGVEVLHDKSKHTHQSLVWYSDDGFSWGKAHEVGALNFWLWRMTWHEGRVYSVAYDCGADSLINLYSSDNGLDFSVLAPRLVDEGEPNEASLLFQGDTCYCLLRREKAHGLLGSALPPYTDWEWKDIGVGIGGPHMICLPDGRFVAGVRLYDGEHRASIRTSLGWIDERTGQFTETLKLPSGGDTSYPGLVWHEDRLWVSYYSSHKGKTAIYFACVGI